MDYVTSSSFFRFLNAYLNLFHASVMQISMIVVTRRKPSILHPPMFF